ncbi:FtsX-like permease family protein [Pseudothermotoga sp.]
MFKAIVKIAMRNFLMRFKSTFVLIVGMSIPAMLLVGGLSLNDTVANWINRSLKENFGPADVYVENPRNNIFVRLTLDQQTVDAIKARRDVLAILPVSESLVRLKHNEKTIDCLAMGVRSEDLSNFVGKEINIPPQSVIVSKDLAEALNIKQNDIVSINMTGQASEFKVVLIGEEGFLNFRGDHLQLPGVIFMNLDELTGVVGFPTRLYLHIGGKIEEHEAFVNNLRQQVRVSAVAMKSRLLNSPVNRALGYLTIAFGGFSILASLILVYLFAQSFLEERNTTLVTLRILGFKSSHVLLLLILEGFAYFLVSGLFGAGVGMLLAQFLLERLKNFSSDVMSGTLWLSRLELRVSFLSILAGVLGGLAMPLMIFLLKARRIVSGPAVRLLRFEEEGEFPFKGSKLRYVGLAIIMLAILLMFLYPKFSVALLLLAIVGALMVFPSSYLAMLLGIALFVYLFQFRSSELTSWDVLQRGAAFFSASWLLFFSLLAPLRKLFSRSFSENSVSTFIALSYVQRNKRNSFIIALMFSLIVFVVILTLVVPYNVQRFAKEQLETGIFGYNFMVMQHPLKLLFSRGELEIAEGIKFYARIYMAQFNNEPIFFVDDNFIRNAVVKALKNDNWRKALLEPGTLIVGFIGKQPVPEQLSGRIKPMFGLGASEEITFRVVESFDVRQVMIPARYVASINSAPKNVRLVPILLAKVDDKDVSRVKDFYSERFDFPVHISEELNRLFSGIDFVIKTGLILLYFGLLSGLSGVVFHTMRSIVVRRKLTAVMKAIGMTNRSVGLSFIVENVTMASLGILVGVFAAVLFSKDVMDQVFSMIGSGQFSFPVLNVFAFVVGLYAVVTLVIVLPVAFGKLNLAESLRVLD